ncbi:hypothetical protein GCM10011581_19570 [Saccharopolyspora subtropica]|uniref:Uncharacterized protein n=1 Tax=Saccharopolyspora thermophila TaxID=89367 RepID=A0A917JSU5_9PSEU|nr:hypothetical protein [Saccharopolyspora subtropica]GGI82239.1 hypothetical protein GCM10011581_19570 [Saccharopolyspora subtropica]
MTFTEHGRAAQSQRISTTELAALIGADLDELVPDPAPGQDPELRDRFVQQLKDWQGDEIASAVLMVLNAWTQMGGTLSYGVAASETSCFLLSRTVYPSGKFEIVFQHLRVRVPFDDDALRDEFRQRLNKIEGVDLPAVKLDFRPGFALKLLRQPQARDVLFDALEWFHSIARGEKSSRTTGARETTSQPSDAVLSRA